MRAAIYGHDVYGMGDCWTDGWMDGPAGSVFMGNEVFWELQAWPVCIWNMNYFSCFDFVTTT